MRTTLDIADDVLHAAKERARREKRMTGEIISELARQALNALPPGSRAREPRATCGFRPFPKRGGIVTNELIDKLRDMHGPGCELHDPDPVLIREPDDDDSPADSEHDEDDCEDDEEDEG